MKTSFTCALNIRSLPVRAVTFGLLATLLIALPSHALRFIRTITPDSKEELGMTVKFKRATEGAYSFTVTRHNIVGDFALAEGKVIDTQIARPTDYRADLEVRKGDKLIVRTPVAAQTQGNNLVFTFELARDCIKDSRFSFSDGGVLGVDIYQVDLKEIDRRIQASIPQHP